MFPYYIGIVSSLHDLGIIQKSKTPLAGASAGSLIAACYHAGVSSDLLMDATLENAESLRKTGTFRKLGLSLETVLNKYLPDDAHEACNGAAHIAITTVSTRTTPTAPYSSAGSRLIDQSCSHHAPLTCTATAACYALPKQPGHSCSIPRPRSVTSGLVNRGL